ncbi:biotin/lipoyl attachment domain-containing protein [Gemmatirosa kalamazoonensis]|uniref:Biotin/lipoyl attachment domain-containing protein n=1 Tax=Gemmatirosa kalamazoonensis TaxID=861299 RepID=W0RKI7_9BACT|nr:acetyl-CoA carboxylase biotin carboxyl carrier protein subunit [Gemmatirosa kalamazoonensis]AHG90952.1 biotin/lipoyl attachment domain-containing protein [Gemmatirosa kalamazoonensis]
MRYVVEVDGERRTVDVTGDEVEIDGERLHARLVDIPGTPVSLLTLGDRVYRLIARRGDRRGKYTLSLDCRRFAVEALDERTRAIRDLSAASAAAAGPAPLVAPMPGLVVRVNVAVGDAVHAGQGLVVMEAMKMENELRATTAGTVAAIRVEPGTAVEKGAVLVELG